VGAGFNFRERPPRKSRIAPLSGQLLSVRLAAFFAALCLYQRGMIGIGRSA